MEVQIVLTEHGLVAARQHKAAVQRSGSGVIPSISFNNPTQIKAIYDGQLGDGI